jgi:hypothetical protein
MWGIGRGSDSTFLIVFFVLAITFCLVSAGIFKANTTIGMDAAYAKKSKESSGGSSDGGGDSKSSGDDKGGDNSGSSTGSTGGETGIDSNNPKTEEPSIPPTPSIEEPIMRYTTNL